MDMVDNDIKTIRSYYDTVNDKIFVLQSIESPEDLYLTYNIYKGNYEDKPDNTMLVHRNYETNTIYTINAINKISIHEIGRIDRNYRINWNSYRNTIILSRGDELLVRKTQLLKIVVI